MSPEGALRDWNGPGYQLIETLRWQQAHGFAGLDRHLGRLEQSAAALGFAFDRFAVVTTLEAAPRQGQAGATRRVRLTLDPDGHAAAVSEPFTPTLPGTVWRLQVALTRLDSWDRLLRHKTSRRSAYEAARAEFPRDIADEVLLLNERGELCEGTVTTLFLDPGNGSALLTPPLDCGLLAGVLRQELIDSGQAVERVLLPGDLAGAAIYVGNSLRGLIRAELP